MLDHNSSEAVHPVTAENGVEADENRKERLSISGRYPRSLSETSTEKPGMKHEAALKAADTELTRSCQSSFTSSVKTEPTSEHSSPSRLQQLSINGLLEAFARHHTRIGV